MLLHDCTRLLLVWGRQWRMRVALIHLKATLLLQHASQCSASPLLEGAIAPRACAVAICASPCNGAKDEGFACPSGMTLQKRGGSLDGVRGGLLTVKALCNIHIPQKLFTMRARTHPPIACRLPPPLSKETCFRGDQYCHDHLRHTAPHPDYSTGLVCKCAPQSHSGGQESSQSQVKPKRPNQTSSKMITTSDIAVQKQAWACSISRTGIICPRGMHDNDSTMAKRCAGGIRLQQGKGLSSSG